MLHAVRVEERGTGTGEGTGRGRMGDRGGGDVHHNKKKSSLDCTAPEMLGAFMALVYNRAQLGTPGASWVGHGGEAQGMTEGGGGREIQGACDTSSRRPPPPYHLVRHK